jgi:hypothetical protein
MLMRIRSCSLHYQPPGATLKTLICPVQSAHCFPLTPLQAECYKSATRLYASLLFPEEQDADMIRR